MDRRHTHAYLWRIRDPIVAPFMQIRLSETHKSETCRVQGESRDQGKAIFDRSRREKESTFCGMTKS